MSEPLLLFGPRSALGIDLVPGGWGMALKAALPVVGFLLVLPVLALLFRGTWRELDAEAADHQMQRRGAGTHDYRPYVLFAITALVLTLQDYYGGRDFYRQFLYPWLRSVELAQLADPGGLGRHVDIKTYSELYSYGWWAFTRIAGYSVLPLFASNVQCPCKLAAANSDSSDSPKTFTDTTALSVAWPLASTARARSLWVPGFAPRQ